ncbi:rho guanine nucleotide exchange factor 11 isoform X4 [Fundulus heteroclitus]|uniref:rho guanine nucleotide exchange factor 11 isoform X4 n=1 Tax=Fundulus heteroclitus TaxID=8078 RepID=UPI00165A2610|nr:rho guanine nucleotide exchange factor 11 isoform X4 [Fundulus heteroclitus]
MLASYLAALFQQKAQALCFAGPRSGLAVGEEQVGRVDFRDGETAVWKERGLNVRLFFCLRLVLPPSCTPHPLGSCPSITHGLFVITSVFIRCLCFLSPPFRSLFFPPWCSLTVPSKRFPLLRLCVSCDSEVAGKKHTHLFSPFAAWFNSLTIGDSERRAPASQQRELTVDDSASPGLVQRCVVVQKDQLGFGFTVCGERVKLVQNVRPGGAAVKAGVQEGDRIIKVNGSLVSSMTHQEVVKLIKSGPYVALTLQGPATSATSQPLEPLPTDPAPNHRSALAGEGPPPPPPPLPSGPGSTASQRITGPKPLQDPVVQKHASQILRKMLEQEEAELQVLMDERLRNPSPSLEERIESAKRRAHQVRVKIQNQEGTRSESVTSYIQAGEGRLSMDSSEGDSEVVKSQIISPEEEDEDGYAFNEMDGPFQDIELLKSRPAHMTVFMRYVFTQLLDPNPLLFYLSVEAYLGSSPKDARALAPQICSHFLDPDAPLKIKVREEYLTDIETRLHAQEDIRGPLSELQQQVLPDIQEQILDYRSKQMMGLGSLFGEGDLLQLDGDPLKERQVVDRQVTALWEILSKHEEDRSSPLASAVVLYLRHSGIKLRDSKVFPGLSTEKEKWLAFLKSKKPSSVKKDKDGDDKRRNPILKYIGKPRSVSQSTFHVPLSPTEVRSGSVRNIIQQFENHTELPGEEDGDGADPQRLSSSSLGEEGMDSPTVSVRLGRSGSLKAQGEDRRRGAVPGGDSVPRSRSDVDMEDCEEREQPGLRLLHLSTSSSASSSSARSLENPTPPYTPRSRRRSVDSQLALLPDAVVLEDEVCDGQNWRDTVPPELLATLSPKEVERQAVIYELFTSEVSHLRTLRVLDKVFYRKMRSVLNPEELACIFPNLPQVYELHASLCEEMKKRRESPIVQDIGDVMLAKFEGAAGSEFQEHASQLCCQQTQALELIKNKKRKESRFAQIILECEASPQCRRLQLKDLLVSEMQRLTKYPLLLDNIIKYTEGGSSDLPSLRRAQACCRGILKAVNEDVRETEHRQRLSQYQRRLDAAPQFKSLDLTTKTMIHEGPLIWKVNKDKQIEIQALLLSDCLVLLQKGPDDRLQLRYPSRWLGGAGGVMVDNKPSFSPLVKLDALLVRSVATDKKALYIISTAETLIYELVAGSPSEKDTWIGLLEKTTKASSPMTNHRSLSVPSPRLRGTSPVLTEVNPVEEQVGFMESLPSNHGAVLGDLPSDQLGAGSCDENLAVGVADAALHDVETLRKLLLPDVEEDRWSHDTEDTPTNTMSNGNAERRRQESTETVLDLCINESEPKQPEAPPPDSRQPDVKVVRKAVVAGAPPPPPSSSVPEDITDGVSLPSDLSSQSGGEAGTQGNMFYLVLPSEQGESATDDLPDPPTPTASHFPLPLEEVTSAQTRPEEEAAACSPEFSQSETDAMQMEVDLEEEEEEEETGPAQAGQQSHVIKNVDEIFVAIESLTSKLHKLKEIERAHQKLLESLRDPSFSQESEDQPCRSATVSRTPSMDRSSVDGKEGTPAEPKILSTGF